VAIVAAGSVFQGLAQRSTTSQPLRLSSSALFQAGDDVARQPTKQRPVKHRVAV
jgi:hypothetical protein